ncbi:glycoside hydrolase [Pleurocapsa sp. CCALA 161]|uniref:glycosyltransferase family 4 protein n=1 Tax=Pleurocapsa sp. CCALA 161 TaxID=2107688 RepID=UPI000D04D15F|nr:glycosyltransferase [Pleurocapsa sp. CCALA 161]PSB09465.1 glycoside hydrolase [Pleurocapsa sp. CCALA 161]
MKVDSNQTAIDNAVEQKISKLKILFIITSLTSGGAQVMLLSLLSSINRDRFEPTVISLMDKGIYGEKIEQLEIPVYCVEMLAGKPTISSIRRMTELIKQVKPDLIQGWMYHANLAAQFFNFFIKGKTPVLWSIHHSLHAIASEKLLTQAIIRFGAWSSKYVDKVAFVSEKSQAQHQQVGYPKANSCVIPNGFDTSEYKPSAEIRQKFRQELDIADHIFLIGSVARYHAMKDHDNFLRAAHLILAEHPETKFVMVGTNVDYENQALTSLIDSLGIGKNVYLLGQRSDIPQITPALDILTSSSAYGEAFPLVLGEAMSCEVPCVVTDIGDSAWIVGDTGKVVPPKNPTALAQAWQEVIKMDTSAKADLGKLARRRIIDKFSLASIVAQYEHLYQSVIALQN